MKQFIHWLFLFFFHIKACFPLIENLYEKQFKQYSIELTQDILQMIQTEISSQCYQILTKAFTQSLVQDLYLSKLFRDSGKLFNDLGSYSDCFHKRYKITPDTTTETIESKLTFIIYSIKSQEKELLTQSKLLGACLPLGCIEDEYVTFFKAFTRIMKIDLDEDTIIRAYDVKEGNTTKSLLEDKLSNNYYPLFLMLIILSLSFIPKAISKLFKWFHSSTSLSSSKRKGKEKEASSSSSELRQSRIQTYKKKILPNFIINLRTLRTCFDISDNASELKHTKITMKDITIINDTGLSFTSGLRGIAMICIVIGLIFEHLDNSPLKLLHLKKMLHFLQSLSFSFIIFCKRFGIHLGYSISGLCLTYKLLCYLDNEITKLDSLALSNDNEDNNNNHTQIDKIGELSQLPSLTDLMIEDESCKYLSYRSKIKLKILMLFYSRQLYKYTLFIGCVIFFKYSYWIVISKVSNISPMWIYIKEELINLFGFSNVLSTIFLYDLYIPNSKFPKNPFSVVINEISYFIFGSLLIFYFYKNNYRLDKFILYVCGLLSIMKLALFLALFFQRDRTKKYYPAKNFITETYFSFIQKNSLYNFPIFLIGVFFGLVNYSYQKSIEMSYSKASKTNKKMLILPIKFISFFQGLSKSKVRLCAIISMIAFIVAIFGFHIVYNCLFNFDDKRLEDFFENVYSNLYFLYDIDIATWLIFLIVYPLSFTGDNFLIYFLKHDYWRYVSRPYFVFLLISNMVIYYILYKSDSKIQIDFVIVSFFVLLAILILFILNTIVYIFYDVPLKKLSKTVIYAHDQLKDDISNSRHVGSKLTMFKYGQMIE